MENIHVIEAHSEMTGGGCLTYWGKFSNGLYFAWFDDVFSVFDADYGVTFTKEFFKATGGDTYGWENEHILRTIETQYMWHFVEEAKELLKGKQNG